MIIKSNKDTGNLVVKQYNYWAHLRRRGGQSESCSLGHFWEHSLSLIHLCNSCCIWHMVGSHSMLFKIFKKVIRMCSGHFHCFVFAHYFLLVFEPFLFTHPPRFIPPDLTRPQSQGVGISRVLKAACPHHWCTSLELSLSFLCHPCIWLA